MRTIFVLFGGYHEAAASVEELVGKGFDTEEMNAIAQAAVLRAGTRRPRLAGRGRTAGIDLLISNCKEATLPGAGAACVAGREAQDAAAATHEGPGTSLADALAGLGVPDELAKVYDSGIAEGGVLFWIRVPEARFAQASDILSDPADRKVSNYG